MTCIRIGMFLIMREEECAKSKGDGCTSGTFALKGNVAVKLFPACLALLNM